MSARDGQGERGFTLIELMISLVIASLAIGFIFRIYATSSVAYRTQSQVSELQQTLRTAKQLLTKELRAAGYYAGTLNTAVDTGISNSGAFIYPPIAVTNSASGPDSFTISYADTTCSARVSSDKNSSFKAADTRVDRTDCFVDGDVIAAVRTKDGNGGSKKGQGCVLQITGVQGSASRVNHNPGQSVYNNPGNDQCSNIDQDWTDGHTVFVKFWQKAYRIKPGDARGVLQVLPAGSATWQDLAFGFVDMQLAIQVYDTVGTDVDGDGDAKVNWYSGGNMAAIPSTGTMLQMRISLVARTIAEVEGVGTLATPSLIDPANSSRPNNNMVGDRPAVTLASVTDKTSPYYGNYIYRYVSTVVDLRNLGTGQEQ